ncbi:MFS transporter [Phototrophicus methaneseepsis]|uniref:MFS transporter n=1 Tax=Phototrophicus methaneseepsis TaxID=2710758 RepID=A0A7S8IF30_9CHLR|nr:MFS transporter [Phototrophicus methaneseepsis]QPC83191.1 MFS transporter [Phototrophicus methaneseepsis]
MHFPRTKQFWAVGLGHMANDIMMTMGVVLLTFLSGSLLPMTNTQIGLAVSSQQLAGALSQPFFGGIADKRGGRWVGAGGLIGTAVAFLLTIIMAATTHNYVLMLIPFVIQGLGSGAVHPVGMLNAAESDHTRVASNMSYFFLMGQFGGAIGPLLLGILLDAANVSPLVQITQALNIPWLFTVQTHIEPVFLVPLLALPSIIMMTRNIPMRDHVHEARPKRTQEKDAAPVSLLRVAAPFIALTLMVILRALAHPGSVNFIPVLFQQKGWSPAQYGAITSVFWVASGISGVVFGNLADRYDRRRVITASLLLAAPAFFLLPITDGVFAFGLAIAAGGFVGGSHSIIVVLAQDLIPVGKGMAGGAVLGFIFGAGAFGSLIIGTLSDSITLGTTFQLVAVTTAASGIIALFLPRPASQEENDLETEPEPV